MNNKTIYALGYFDGVHLGHHALLTACAELAKANGCQSGAVTFIGHPQQLIHGTAVRFINTAADRRKLLLRTVHTVAELDFTQSLMSMAWQDFLHMLVTEYDAAGFVCGSDFRFGFQGQGSALLLQDYCKSNRLSCQIVPQQFLEGIRISSSHIRTLLEQGQIAKANAFLGHKHMLSGTVGSGKQFGRTIGFPTANLPYPDCLISLPYGVYACHATVDGQCYQAVTNIGVRPTVSGEGITVESHLLNFSHDLYGKTVTLEFTDFIRPEKKFRSAEELQKQIMLDVQHISACNRE